MHLNLSELKSIWFLAQPKKVWHSYHIPVGFKICNVFSFPCCLYVKRDKFGLSRKQLFILILRFQSEDAQQYAAMWVGGLMDFGRISRQESIRTIPLSESSLKFCASAFITSASQSPMAVTFTLIDYHYLARR